MAVAVVGFIASLSYKRELLWSSISFGGLLALVDFFIQSMGEYFGLWQTHGSALSVWGVPAEVLVIAVLAGSIVARAATDVNPALLGATAAIGGTAIEYWLTTLSYNPVIATAYVPAPLEYLAWHPILAFIAYFTVFTLFAYTYIEYLSPAGRGRFGQKRYRR